MATARQRISADFISAVCTNAELVGHFVYMTPSAEVRRVDIANRLKMPAFGVIVQKPNATSCVVQISGVVANVFFGMTPGNVLISQGGTPTNTLTYPLSGVRWIQLVGTAIAADRLALNFHRPVGVVPL